MIKELTNDKDWLKYAKIVNHYKHIFEAKGDLVKHMNNMKDNFSEIELHLKKIWNHLWLSSTLSLGDTFTEIKKELGMK